MSSYSGGGIPRWRASPSTTKMMHIHKGKKRQRRLGAQGNVDGGGGGGGGDDAERSLCRDAWRPRFALREEARQKELARKELARKEEEAKDGLGPLNRESRARLHEQNDRTRGLVHLLLGGVDLSLPSVQSPQEARARERAHQEFSRPVLSPMSRSRPGGGQKKPKQHGVGVKEYSCASPSANQQGADQPTSSPAAPVSPSRRAERNKNKSRNSSPKRIKKRPSKVHVVSPAHRERGRGRDRDHAAGSCDGGGGGGGGGANTTSLRPSRGGRKAPLTGSVVPANPITSPIHDREAASRVQAAFVRRASLSADPDAVDTKSAPASDIFLPTPTPTGTPSKVWEAEGEGDGRGTSGGRRGLGAAGARKADQHGQYGQDGGVKLNCKGRPFFGRHDDYDDDDDEDLFGDGKNGGSSADPGGLPLLSLDDDDDERVGGGGGGGRQRGKSGRGRGEGGGAGDYDEDGPEGGDDAANMFDVDSSTDRVGRAAAGLQATATGGTSGSGDGTIRVRIICHGLNVTCSCGDGGQDVKWLAVSMARRYERQQKIDPRLFPKPNGPLSGGAGASPHGSLMPVNVCWENIPSFQRHSSRKAQVGFDQKGGASPSPLPLLSSSSSSESVSPFTLIRDLEHRDTDRALVITLGRGVGQGRFFTLHRVTQAVQNPLWFDYGELWLLEQGLSVSRWHLVLHCIAHTPDPPRGPDSGVPYA